jgi:hypothetical protein
MAVELEYPHVHLAHATLVEERDLAVCGLGPSAAPVAQPIEPHNGAVSTFGQEAAFLAQFTQLATQDFALARLGIDQQGIGPPIG